VLRLTSVSKRFGEVVAVNDVSVEIPAGQMVGIIGRSGAGKSTLLRLINRLVDPTSGSITFDGAEITALRGKALHAWRAKCAMIFQQFNLIPRLDVITNVLIGRINYRPTLSAIFKLFTPAERALAVLALDRLDMTQQALQRADTLSGGQQQRVAIARALTQEPGILLADEPIASLDPRNATLVMDALRSINVEDGITVICNLHTVDTARVYCDRIVGMVEGRTVFDGPSADLSSEKIREIYGVDGESGDFDVNVTSTGLEGHRRKDGHRKTEGLPTNG
jgi:phosphonate transport system ATP-binding protein